MKRSSLVAGVCCVALLSSNTFAAAEGLGLQLQLHFGGQSAPQRMELAMQAPLTLFGALADPLEAGLLNAPLLISEWQQGRTRTHVLGVPLGGDPQVWQLNADGDGGVVGWLWGGVAVVGALVLVAVAAGGGGGKNGDGPNDRPTASGGPSAEVGGCQIVQTNLQDPASPNIFNCNIGGG